MRAGAGDAQGAVCFRSCMRNDGAPEPSSVMACGRLVCLPLVLPLYASLQRVQEDAEEEARWAWLAGAGSCAAKLPLHTL